MRNSLKLMGLAAVMWFGVAGSANAVTSNIGFQLDPAGSSSYGATFGNTIAANTAGSSFSDDFLFFLPSSLPQIGGASVISGFGPQAQAFNVEFSKFELFNHTANTLEASGGAGTFFSNFAIPLQAASSDVYRLHVEGNLLAPNLIGNYGGALTISPVPEPETYAMLLVGLGLLGFAARRRSHTTI